MLEPNSTYSYCILYHVAAHASVLTIDSEPTVPIEDQRLDAASGAATLEAIETNPSPALRMAYDSEEPDSSPNSEPPAPPPIESDWAPIMEFTAADIFQHSPSATS